MDIGLRLEDYQQSLTKVSYDSDNEEVSLIVSESIAYNLDSITKQVCEKLRGKQAVSSCDALVRNEDIYYLIEFKNQRQEKIERSGIQKKAYDSFATVRLTFEQNISLDDLCRKLILLVVFKDEEVKGLPHIQQKLYELACPEGDEPLLFGLGDIKGQLYSDVHTISRSKFLEKWYPMIWPD